MTEKNMKRNIREELRGNANENDCPNLCIQFSRSSTAKELQKMWKNPQPLLPLPPQAKHYKEGRFSVISLLIVC